MNIMCLRQTHAEFRYADAPGGVPEKLGLVGLRIPRCWRPRVSNLAAVAVIQGLNWVMLRFRGVIQVDGGIIAVRVGQPSRSGSKYWRSEDPRPLAPTHAAKAKKFEMPGWSQGYSGVAGEGTRRFRRTGTVREALQGSLLTGGCRTVMLRCQRRTELNSDTPRSAGWWS